MDAASGRLGVSEPQFRRLFAWANIGMVMADLNGRFIAVNPAFCAMVGYGEAELLQTGFLALTHPDDVAVSRETFGRMVAGDTRSVTMEKRYLRKDGRTIWGSLAISFIRDDDGRPVHTMATVEDITARKIAEDELQRSQALQRVAGRLARVGGWTLEVPGMEFFASDELREILERVGGVVSLDEGLARVLRPYRERLAAALHDCVTMGTPYDLEFPVADLQGGAMWIRDMAEPQRNEDGNIVRVIGAVQDITELREATEETREIAERLTTTVESITDGFCTLDREWRITYINHRAEEFLGRPAGALLGRHVWEEFPEALWSEVGIVYRRAMTEGTTQVIEEHYFEPLDAWFNIRVYPSAAGLTVFFQDVTERRRLDALHRRSQRMESIGTLAGGLAHDLNNALAPVTMATELLQLGETDEARLRILETIASGTERATAMVRQILSFVAGLEGRRVSLDVNDLLRDVERIANDTFLKTIRIVREEATDVWSVTGDPTQLGQVLINLCLNARDAMPHGGTLVLAADNAVVDEVPRDTQGGEPTRGRYVRIRVEDDGQGMTPKALDHIFEPFYTTKERGTGLGLSTSIGIISSHGGFVRVETAPGAGSRFLVHLPAVGDAGLPRSLPGASARPNGNGELVLVVDDEPDIRMMLDNVLTGSGYRVLEAASGAAAVAAVRQTGSRVDVVLTDLTMPGMDGLATVRALRDIRPDLPIVLVSGLRPQTMIDEAADLGVQHFLSKPFSTATLLQTLGEVLKHG